MLHVDVLSAYLICGVSALVAAAMLRLVAAEPRLRDAIGTCSAALLTLGAGLLPAGLAGDAVAHPAAQFSLGFGSVAGIVWMARGLARLQGHDPPRRRTWALLAALAAATAALLWAGPLPFGRGFAVALAAASTLLAWSGGGFVRSPRDTGERALGVALVLLAATSWLRAGFTLAYVGPPRTNLLYVPDAIAPLYAALYGVMPMFVATQLLGLLNTRLHQQLNLRANTDELTGTMTRRALVDLAPRLVERSRHEGLETAVLMLDLDHFKVVNDTHGHATGDEVLRLAAATLRAQLRSDALLARYGGEEFVALVPVDGVATARRVAERLRTAVEAADWSPVLPRGQGVTVSVGVALAGAHEGLDGSLARADEALYRAKREGRNQVQVNLKAA